MCCLGRTDDDDTPRASEEATRGYGPPASQPTGCWSVVHTFICLQNLSTVKCGQRETQSRLIWVRTMARHVTVVRRKGGTHLSDGAARPFCSVEQMPTQRTTNVRAFAPVIKLIIIIDCYYFNESVFTFYRISNNSLLLKGRRAWVHNQLGIVPLKRCVVTRK